MWILLRKIYRPVQNLPSKIYRLLYWLPIIWKDRWYDDSFFLKILEHKLLYNAVRFEKLGLGVTSEDDAKRMRVAAALCKRIYEDNYTTPWDEEAREDSRERFSYMRSNKVERNGVIFYTSQGYEPDPRRTKMSKWAFERKNQMRALDLEELLRIFRKHLFGWWD